LPERKLFKHTRYAAILSKRIFWFYFELFQLYTISFMPNLGIKDVVSIWLKNQHERSYWSLNGRSNFQ
jgi:hypothetical protein